METKIDITNETRKDNVGDLKQLDNNELFDRLIDDINGWGWFQKRMWVLSLIVSIVAACNHLSPLYTAYKPEYRCISSSRNHKFQSYNYYYTCSNLFYMGGK